MAVLGSIPTRKPTSMWNHVQMSFLIIICFSSEENIVTKPPLRFTSPGKSVKSPTNGLTWRSAEKRRFAYIGIGTLFLCKTKF